MRLSSLQWSLKWKTDATRGTREAGSIGKKNEDSRCEGAKHNERWTLPQQEGGNSTKIGFCFIFSLCKYDHLVCLTVSLSVVFFKFLTYFGHLSCWFFFPSLSQLVSLGRKEEWRQRSWAVSVHNWSWHCRCPLIPVSSYSSTCTVFYPSFFTSPTLSINLCVHNLIKPSSFSKNPDIIVIYKQ